MPRFAFVEGGPPVFSEEGVKELLGLHARAMPEWLSGHVDGVEEKFPARDEPAVELVAHLGGNGAAISKHSQRVNEVKGFRCKVQMVDIGADELSVARADFVLEHGVFSRAQHFFGEIDSDQLANIAEGMEVTAGAAPDVEDVDGVGEGIADFSECAAEPQMVFGADFDFVVATVAVSDFAILFLDSFGHDLVVHLGWASDVTQTTASRSLAIPDPRLPRDALCPDVFRVTWV